MSAANIVDSFDMRTCSISVRVNAKLEAEFACSAETLDAVRAGRLVCSPHLLYRAHDHATAARIRKYVKRGFMPEGPPQPPE